MSTKRLLQQTKQIKLIIIQSKSMYHVTDTSNLGTLFESQSTLTKMYKLAIIKFTEQLTDVMQFDLIEELCLTSRKD